MTDIVITAAKRTAIGKFMGSLSDYSAPELGKLAIEAVLNENNLDKNLVDELIMGQVLTGGSGQNPARQSSMLAGLPIEKSALTINQVCGSGLRAVTLGAQSIMTNQSDIVIAGGQESMTNAHHTINVRNGLKMGDGKLKDSMIIDGLWCAMNDYHMGTTAENISEKYNISKQDQDEFATLSQNKAEEAQKKNKFESEILSVAVKQKKETVEFNNDEFPRHGSTLEKISSLKPVFKKDGTVTAGNASGLNDGAAAMLLASEKGVKENNLKPIARIVSSAVVGVEPKIMGIGPVMASNKALQKAGLKMKDMDIIELNEAFSAQALACIRKWGLQDDDPRINPNGGAIAIGHPLGVSGTRILQTAAIELKKQNKKYALVTMCIGVGQGYATIIERV